MRPVQLSLPKKISLILLGVVLALATLEFGMRAAGWVWLAAQANRNDAAMSRGGTYTILCIGESTTAFGGAGSYPRLLEKILNRRSNGRRYTVINGGVPRSTTDRIRDALPGQIEKYRPDLVVAMMGINDQRYLERGPRDSVVSWVREFRVIQLFSLLYENLSRREVSRTSGNSSQRAAGTEKDQNASYEELVDQVRESPTDLNLIMQANLLAHSRGMSFWRDHPRAEEPFLEAIERDPGRSAAWADLIRLYNLRGDYGKAMEAMGSAVEHCEMPRPSWEDYLESVNTLRRRYVKQRNFDLAKDVVRQALAALPANLSVLRGEMSGELAVLLRRTGRAEEARPLESSIAGRTRDNYLAIADILRRAGVGLIVVQYPLRSLDELPVSMADAGVLAYVDNSRVFEMAVATYGYSAVFTDRFAGDFGHLSFPGNRLLARNVALVILGVLEP